MFNIKSVNIDVRKISRRHVYKNDFMFHKKLHIEIVFSEHQKQL